MSENVVEPRITRQFTPALELFGDAAERRHRDPPFEHRDLQLVEQVEEIATAFHGAPPALERVADRLERDQTFEGGRRYRSLRGSRPPGGLSGVQRKAAARTLAALGHRIADDRLGESPVLNAHARPDPLQSTAKFAGYG